MVKAVAVEGVVVVNQAEVQGMSIHPFKVLMHRRGDRAMVVYWRREVVLRQI